jgi:hypothetical protein
MPVTPQTKTILTTSINNSSYLLALSLLAMAFMPMLSNLDPTFSSNRWPNLKGGGEVNGLEILK